MSLGHLDELGRLAVRAAEGRAIGRRHDEHMSTLGHPPLRIGDQLVSPAWLEDDLGRTEDRRRRSRTGKDRAGPAPRGRERDHLRDLGAGQP